MTGTWWRLEGAKFRRVLNPVPAKSISARIGIGAIGDYLIDVTVPVCVPPGLVVTLPGYVVRSVRSRIPTIRPLLSGESSSPTGRRFWLPTPLLRLGLVGGDVCRCGRR